jgi:NAD(P)H-flavin reductase
MLDGAMRHVHEPASWGARVVEHRQILSDFAVLRIQPDEPYPYKAGQYLTLEIPSHRRVWRQMSIASAPRADNSFDIHVRAIGGLGVSAALVRATKVGDRLRLGPPRGTDLVVEPGTVPTGLLCIASGTGAAPISAVVESALSWREPPRQLDVFVGGRTREDIYTVDSLNRLIQSRGQWGRARAHGVVSDDPAYVGYRGRVESVVPMLRDWAALGVDVLVAGPNPMIEATVANLSVNRVPRTKIHFDQYEMSAA